MTMMGAIFIEIIIYNLFFESNKITAHPAAPHQDPVHDMSRSHH